MVQLIRSPITALFDHAGGDDDAERAAAAPLPRPEQSHQDSTRSAHRQGLHTTQAVLRGQRSALSAVGHLQHQLALVPDGPTPARRQLSCGPSPTW